jgi:hypothetical protein
MPVILVTAIPSILLKNALPDRCDVYRGGRSDGQHAVSQGFFRFPRRCEVLPSVLGPATLKAALSGSVKNAPVTCK